MLQWPFLPLMYCNAASPNSLPPSVSPANTPYIKMFLLVRIPEQDGAVFVAATFYHFNSKRFCTAGAVQTAEMWQGDV